MTQGRLGEQFRDLEHQHATYRLGIWCFLASEWMLFGGLLLAYLYVRVFRPEVLLEGSLMLDRVLGTLNTGVLLTSSLTVALAVEAFEENKRRCWQWLLATSCLGFVFLGIKGVEWSHELAHMGEHPELKLFFFLYFTITGLHALHLLCGVLCLLLTSFLVARGSSLVRDSHPVMMLGIYWHMVDMIWVFVFPALYLLEAL